MTYFHLKSTKMFHTYTQNVLLVSIFLYLLIYFIYRYMTLDFPIWKSSTSVCFSCTMSMFLRIPCHQIFCLSMPHKCIAVNNFLDSIQISSQYCPLVARYIFSNVNQYSSTDICDIGGADAGNLSAGTDEERRAFHLPIKLYQYHCYSSYIRMSKR